MARRRWLVSLFPLFLCVTRAGAAAGDLDPTFGTGGIVLDPAHGGAVDLLVLDDGRILAGGASNDATSTFMIGRYTSAGALDPTFGIGGHATVSIGAAGDTLTTLVRQPDGKIGAAGYTDLASFDDPSIAV